MDYDKIVEGRRRNWEALKPDEVREKEREDRRDEKRRERDEKVKQGKSFNPDHIRDARKRETEVEDKALFRREVTRAAVLFGIFFGVILAYTALTWYLDYRARENALLNMSAFTKIIGNGGDVNDLTSPVSALASWRSAWIKKDMQRVVNMYSPNEMKRRLSGAGRSLETVVREHRQALRPDSPSPREMVAEVMDRAQFVLVPRAPWHDEELALFRSPPIEEFGTTQATSYILVFSYYADRREWRFVEMRPSEYFNVKWDYESKIRPFRVGPMAPKFDDKGNLKSKTSTTSDSASERY